MLLILLVGTVNSAFASPELNMVNLGEYHTSSGGLIKNVKLGYRTMGTLNADKSNVVLWPTWFTGTSEDVFTSGT